MIRRIRFSQKELSKNAKPLIPAGYSQLLKADMTKETDMAYLISFEKDKTTYKNKWFPKSHCLFVDGKYYAMDWIIKIKIEEL